MATVHEIFQKYGEKYICDFSPKPYEEFLIREIISCKTDKKGYHIYKCNHCHNEVVSYNSCNNRHCPKCGNYKKEVWKLKIRNTILNMGYYHLVVCIPNGLKQIFIQNKEVCYNLFLKVVSESVLELNKNKKIGVIEILHTWSQKLEYHPHVHMILTKQGIRHNKLLETYIDKEVLEKIVRRKLVNKLRTADLSFFHGLSYLNTKSMLNGYLDQVINEPFLVYQKEELNPVTIIDYLARSTFKVGMSDDQLLSIDDGKIKFQYKFWKDREKYKTFTLSSHEYIRKFMLHILPKGFVKIRYFGLFQTKNKTKLSKKYKTITKTNQNQEKFINKIEILNRINHKDITKCQKCGGTLELILTIKNKSPG